MHSDFNILELIINASLVVQLVMLSLMFASVAVWLVALIKQGEIRKMTALANRFEKEFYQAQNLAVLFESEKGTVEKHPCSLQSLFIEGYKEYVSLASHPQALENTSLINENVCKKMNNALNRALASLQNQLSMLATIGASAPYIGLFGTVWGIMSAFSALGQVKHATIALVAPGISEALIATAMGLFVAIPAVIFYNRLSNKLDVLMQQYENYIEDFSALLTKQLKFRKS